MFLAFFKNIDIKYRNYIDNCTNDTVTCSLNRDFPVWSDIFSGGKVKKILKKNCRLSKCLRTIHFLLLPQKLKTAFFQQLSFKLSSTSLLLLCRELSMMLAVLLAVLKLLLLMLFTLPLPPCSYNSIVPFFASRRITLLPLAKKKEKITTLKNVYRYTFISREQLIHQGIKKLASKAIFLAKLIFYLEKKSHPYLLKRKSHFHK